MLQSRGMVDTLSELIVCFLAAAAYAAETAAKNMDSAPVFHFNYSVTDSNATTAFVEFDAPYCLTTCVGWMSTADLAPPLPPKRNSLEVTLLFVFVAFVRVLCLFVENYLMIRSKAIFDKIGAGAIAPSPNVASRSLSLATEKKTKEFSSLTNEEFVAWLEKKVLDLFVESFAKWKVNANILGGDTSEKDLDDFGEFPGVLKKKLIKELKAAVQVGVEIEVEVEVGIEVEAEANNSAAIEEGATDKRAHTLNSVKGGATKVFFSIGPLFFAVSFILALNSVFTGMALWGRWKFGELMPSN